MVALDATVINIALPPRATRPALLARPIANGSHGLRPLVRFAPIDRWPTLRYGGRRTSLYVGLAGFALASALVAGSHNFATLVPARRGPGSLLGAGARARPRSRRSRRRFATPGAREGLFDLRAIGASGAANRLLLGGALTQWASWRWCLFINPSPAIAILGVTFFVAGASARTAHLTSSARLLGSAGLFFVVYRLRARASIPVGAHDITWSLYRLWARVASCARQQRSKKPVVADRC